MREQWVVVLKHKSFHLELEEWKAGTDSWQKSRYAFKGIHRIAVYLQSVTALAVQTQALLFVGVCLCFCENCAALDLRQLNTSQKPLLPRPRLPLRRGGGGLHKKPRQYTSDGAFPYRNQAIKSYPETPAS